MPIIPKTNTCSRKEIATILDIDEYKRLYFIALIGNGSKKQFSDKAQIQSYCVNIFEKYNDNNIVFIYGGDQHNQNKPDIGYVAYTLAQLGAKVVAIQCDEYSNYDAIDHSYIKAVIAYPTQKDGENNVLWGGVKDGELVGASKYMLGVIKPGHLICFGGGDIAFQKAKWYLNNRGGNVVYFSCTDKDGNNETALDALDDVNFHKFKYSPEASPSGIIRM